MLFMKTLLLTLLPAWGLLVAAPVAAPPLSTQPGPQHATTLAALMGTTWRATSAALVVDGTAGTQPAAPDTYRFGPGGRLVITHADGSGADTLRWALRHGGTRLALSRAGQPPRVLAVRGGAGPDGLYLADDFGRRAIRADLRAGVRPSLVQLLLRSAGGYEFAAGSPPPVPAAQLRRLQYQLRLEPVPALAHRSAGRGR